MKKFTYKDIGQHGHSYSAAKPEVSADKPSARPAPKLHKKRALKSVTLVRPNIA